jgi:DNA-binding MarR family transcriptional regulator
LRAAAREFDVDRIDEIIHSRVRLGVMACLMVVQRADFSTLKARLKTTDGTLSVHLRKLEEAGYIAIEKGFRDRRPLTQARLTNEGRKAFRGYLDAIGQLARLGD